MFTIPSKDTKRFSQPNYGDTQGNLWGTFNVDLTKNTGRVRATRTETVFSESDDADLGLPIAFAYFGVTSASDPLFVAYANKVFIGGDDPTDTAWTQDTITGTPTGGDVGDMVVFNGKLYATTATKLKRLISGDTDWDDITTLTSGPSHQLCVYEGRLYYVDNNTISSIDAATETPATTSYTLDLSFIAAGGHISWIQAGSNRIWIGITKKDGSRGTIYEWDGVTEDLPSRPYYIEAQGSAGCAIWNDVPYVLDIEGRLLAFNGSSFEEVARLPIMQYDVLNRSYATSDSKKICHFNGIKYINDAILIAVNNETTGDIFGGEENYPSGIYEYTKENGLTHKFSPSLTVINEPTSDYGQHTVNEIGAIFDASVRRSNANNNFASVMFGVDIETADGSNINAINIDVIQERTNDPDHKRLGYIITPFLESNKITQVWQKIVLKYRKLLDTTDKILVKYRTTKDIPITEQNVVWDSDTQFTATTFTGVEVGMEAEILNGNGAGAVAHVTAITDNGSDFTITLDSSIIGVTAGDISDVRFQKWNQLSEITANDFQFTDLSIPQYNKDTEMQFKIVMNWTKLQNELREVIVVNETDQYAK